MKPEYLVVRGLYNSKHHGTIEYFGKTRGGKGWFFRKRSDVVVCLYEDAVEELTLQESPYKPPEYGLNYEKLKGETTPIYEYYLKSPVPLMSLFSEKKFVDMYIDAILKSIEQVET